MGLLDWFSDENRQPATALSPMSPSYRSLPVDPWPTREDVEAARDYKRRFGNVNEQMIDAPPTPYNPEGNVKYETPGLLTTPLAASNALNVLNRGLLAQLPQQPYDRETADALYAEQLAAQRHPLGYLGYDATKIVPTVASDRGPGLTYGNSELQGMYHQQNDRLWADMRGDTRGTPVHESIHRAVKLLQDRGHLQALSHDDNEIITRAIMLRYHGDIEGRPGFNPQIDEARRRMEDPAFLKQLDQIEQLAGEEIARRNLERGPL